MTTNRIDATFADARREGKRVFIPFVTAGDPDLAATEALTLAFTNVGDSLGVPTLVEIGIPYSDPIADGAIIQTSYTRALHGGFKIAGAMDLARRLRAKTAAPLVAMVSYSLVFRNGVETFLARANDAGFDGAIIPDLPVEEAKVVLAVSEKMDFKIIQLIAPTTPPERLEKIARTTTGFVYVVSVTGITGERDRLPDDLPGRLAELRRHTALPLCVGFGVSKPDHVRMLRDVADGVIVGSAIVRRLGELAPGDSAGVRKIADFVEGLMRPLAK